MNPGIILSLEQATSLPYATQRFVQLGWRVIRIEATGEPGHAGDPNRYVGHEVDAGSDRRASFIAANVGKQAIGLNLKTAQGQALLRHLLEALQVDVFCCNVLPMRYEALGIDYATLGAVRENLIWAGISAFGPDFPEVAGYDPVIQAVCGLMDLNGEPDRAPNLIGVPLTDLKAGDELYASVLLALLERHQSGKGKRIDVSMFQAAASLLTTVLPLVDLGSAPALLTRAGNAHRQFVPTHVYPARDGHIYLAIGSDSQWAKLLTIPGFEGLACDEYRTLALRTANRIALYAALGEVTARFALADLQARLAALNLPHSTINTVPQAMAHPGIADKLTSTRIGARAVRLPPMATDIAGRSLEFDMAPHYGEHTRAVLAEAGLSAAEIADLLAAGVVA